MVPVKDADDDTTHQYQIVDKRKSINGAQLRDASGFPGAPQRAKYDSQGCWEPRDRTPGKTACQRARRAPRKGRIAHGPKRPLPGIANHPTPYSPFNRSQSSG
jgi:hypothetical protein